MDDWRTANHQWLGSSIELLRYDLEHIAYGGHDNDVEQRRDELVATVEERRGAHSEPPALAALSEVFNLSRFESQLLLLCAGTELNGTLANACAAILGTQDHYAPTLSLALSHLDEPHWDAIAPPRPLRRWHLIDVDNVAALSLAPLRIDPRVLHYLTGTDFIDPDLGAREATIDQRDLTPSLRRTANEIADVWERAGDEPTVLVELHGPTRELITCAVAAAERIGLRLVMLPASAIPTEAAARARYARRWERELFLANAVLLVECDGVASDDREQLTALRALAAEIDVPIVYAWDRPSPLAHDDQVARLEVRTPPRSEQRELWRSLLDGDDPAALDDALDDVVAQFDLGPSTIRAAAARALDDAATEDPTGGHDSLNTRLWHACRHQTRQGVDDLATVLTPRASWDNLVLPPEQLEILHAIARHLRHRTRVYDDWGFADRLSRGLGLGALFSGTSGTGKTMAAEVIANEVQLDLFVIDLSMVMNKYIGETEKHLRRLFDVAEQSGAILLFDEADALFGKRTAVKDSHDRYANVGVSYLLTRMECYRGLAVLTTNRRDHIDEAFVRRLRFAIDFPFPAFDERQRIWETVFPDATPLGDLDMSRLAELDVSGGLIRNIALSAAFAAADEGTVVEMRHLAEASRAEYAKSGRILTVKLEDQ